jgi:hypothetical protein
MVFTESVFSSEKMKGISHAIQAVAPGETGVVTPKLHTLIHKGDAE